MMNCRRATRLMSESKERPLSTTERMALRVHTMMCSACRRFDGQLDFLSQAAQRYKSKPNRDNSTDDEPQA